MVFMIEIYHKISANICRETVQHPILDLPILDQVSKIQIQ